MSDRAREIPAALTPEQWQDVDYRQSASAIDAWAKGKAERRQSDDATEYVAQMGITYDDCVTLMSRAHDRVAVPPPARHALAALAMHRQPFGVTEQDVSALRQAADEVAEHTPDAAARLRDLAARLASLLPPAGA
ncbi:MAG TPA: hypothetical protein VFS44_08800 [Gemmatimonadaceae bacterium]|nr:hypothetical protein [Gemmatimonadaceae bacterium]